MRMALEIFPKGNKAPEKYLHASCKFVKGQGF